MFLSFFPQLVPFQRPELGIYCVGVHLLIAFPISILQPCVKSLDCNLIEFKLAEVAGVWPLMRSLSIRMGPQPGKCTALSIDESAKPLTGRAASLC